ncbi:hypothetical protein [Mesorhizobium mediterraneum]|uniref:hypothetical protein n=1 Tax=Mesorhizobium mediterraneum TaxID=43617 RepID=UPI0017822FEC|nr:hypothetical protein [Mesorhizobium mediterraneum]
MFNLNLQVTEPNLEALKAELTRTLSHVKSSHRCEALARSLGFRTYATGRAEAKAWAPIIATVKGDLFQDYLYAHGFECSALPLYLAAGRIALADIRQKSPHLTVWGMGVGRPRHKADGRLETRAELNKRFAEEREELTSDGAVESFLATLALLSRVPPTKTIRQESGSYWLKHIAENFACSYPTGEKLGPRYVPNGAAIAAAIHAGFRFKTYLDENGFWEINVSFNMSKALLIDLDCQMRPTGVYAEERRWKQRNVEEKRQQRTLYRYLSMINGQSA